MSERRSSIELTTRGKKACALIGAILVGAAGTPFIAKAFSGSDKVDTQPVASALSLNEQMDIEIARQLQKGPGPNDEEIARVPILPGQYVNDIMDQVAPASDIDAIRVSILQKKATTKSGTPPEKYYGYPDDDPLGRQERLVVWEDGDLAQKFGEAAILAIPENQIK